MCLLSQDSGPLRHSGDDKNVPEVSTVMSHKEHALQSLMGKSVLLPMHFCRSEREETPPPQNPPGKSSTLEPLVAESTGTEVT